VEHSRRLVPISAAGLQDEGSELGPVSWHPADLRCSEASVAARANAVVLFGRHSTLNTELARTREVRLSN